MAEGDMRQPLHRLAVMRHANAEPSRAKVRDRDRSLTTKGANRAADRRGIVEAFRPTTTLCSVAARAQQTMAELGDAVGTPIVEEPLYYATPSSLLARIESLDEAMSRILVIAHMPTIQIATEALVGREDLEAEGGLPFAPGALVIMDIDTQWAQISPGCARLASFHP